MKFRYSKGDILCKTFLNKSLIVKRIKKCLLFHKFIYKKF